MRSDPFLIDGPAAISFSGGRTSGYMLWRIAERGLRPDVHIVFCNTGKEDDRTLKFVQRFRDEGIPVRVLEYRRRFLPRYKSDVARQTARRFRKAWGIEMEPQRGRWEPGYVEIGDMVAAARASDPPTWRHPFANFLAASGMPNPALRSCTTEMKIRVVKKFMMAGDHSKPGYEHWTNIVGIRADEPDRVAKMRSAAAKERWENAVPLAHSGVKEEDVLRFWRRMPFDLGLRHDPELGTYEGNCDVCMLKSDAKKARMALERPEAFAWWERVEEIAGASFRPRKPLREVRRLALIDVAQDNAFTDLGDCFCRD